MPLTVFAPIHICVRSTSNYQIIAFSGGHLSSDVEQERSSQTVSDLERHARLDLRGLAKIFAAVGLVYWVASVIVGWLAPLLIDWSVKQVGSARAAGWLVSFIATQLQALAHPIIAGLLFAAAIVCAIIARHQK